MDNVIDITEFRKEKIRNEKARILELRSSMIALETCYRLLNISRQQELIDIKIKIKIKIMELQKVLNDR